MAHIGRCDIRDRLTDRHATRCRAIQQRDRWAFADRHRFPGVTAQARQRHRDIADRHLPGSDQRIAADEATDAAVADGHEESLVGNRRQPQQSFERLRRIDAAHVESTACAGAALRLAPHPRWLAEQRRHRHVDRVLTEMRIVHQQLAVAGGASYHGAGAAFATA